jgi:glycosyltransferase involved in cell wall biosynthesis
MTKKNVLIDLDRLKMINTGLGQVAYLFGKVISQLNDTKLKFTFLVPPKFKGAFGSHVDYEIVSLRRRYCPSLCKSYDLWHAIHQDSAYFPGDRRTPYLLTIHDLNFLNEKTESKAQKRLKLLQTKVERASKITTISRYSENIIHQNLRLEGKEVTVVYNGVEQKSSSSHARPSFLPEGKFLFTISVLRKKKNFKVLVDFMKELKDYNLIIAGNKSGSYAKELEEDILSKELQNRIILPGEISDEVKYWLYQNCEAFVFPSMYEGFGLPVIEAMNFGKPVFLSTMSSLPEIGGAYAFYWERFDSQYMYEIFREKMVEFSTNNAEKRLKMKQYANQFTWEKNAAAYLRIYKELLNLK